MSTNRHTTFDIFLRSLVELNAVAFRPQKPFLSPPPPRDNLNARQCLVPFAAFAIVWLLSVGSKKHAVSTFTRALTTKSDTLTFESC